MEGYRMEQGMRKERSETARMQDQLTGALVGLARTCVSNEKTPDTDRLLLAGLAATMGEDPEELQGWVNRIREEKHRVAPNCAFCAAPCGNTSDYDLARLWNAEPAVRDAKIQMLAGLRQLAALIQTAASEELELIYRALYLLAEDWEAEELLSVAGELKAAVAIRNNKQ